MVVPRAACRASGFFHNPLPRRTAPHARPFLAGPGLNTNFYERPWEGGEMFPAERLRGNRPDRTKIAANLVFVLVSIITRPSTTAKSSLRTVHSPEIHTSCSVFSHRFLVIEILLALGQ